VFLFVAWRVGIGYCFWVDFWRRYFDDFEIGETMNGRFLFGRRIIGAAVWIAMVLGGFSRAGSCAEIVVKLEAAKEERPTGIVRAVVQIPEAFAKTKFVFFDYDDSNIDREVKMAFGQLIAPSLSAELAEGRDGMVARELVVLNPGQGEGAPAVTMRGTLGSTKLLERVPNLDPEHMVKEFEKAVSWHDTAVTSTELRFKDRPVLRYMHEAVDNSSKERRAETFKVYHHVFDPEGDRLLTKGPGGLFPHHRGLFYGFNKISYGDKQQADVWHCNKGESQTHVKVLSQDAGPLLGRHRVAIDWHGQDGKVFAKEERELTAYTFGGAWTDKRRETKDHDGTLIDFTSTLTSTVGPLRLDGDPQHAGFQFRASQEVPDKTKDQTYYLRPDGKGEPGKFRNWPQDKGHENLAWNALSFVIEGQRYTVVYLDHPKNPKPARYSERDYGRFGSYFVAEVDEGKPLTARYRVWVQRGEMTFEECEALSQAFVAPVKVEVEVKE
jgi:hypothetical protein